MGVQVTVGEAQDIEQALRAFRAKRRREYQRPWYKRRYGYHEKPSELKRKRKKMQGLRAGGSAFEPHCLKLFIGEQELWERNGPTMAAGR